MKSENPKSMIRIDNGTISVKTGVAIVAIVIQGLTTYFASYYGNKMALNNMDNKYARITDNLSNKDLLLDKDIDALKEKYQDLKSVLSYRNEAIKPEETTIRHEQRYDR